MEDFTSKHTFIRKATPLEGKLTPRIHICGWFPPRIGVAMIFSGGAFFPFPLKVDDLFLVVALHTQAKTATLQISPAQQQFPEKCDFSSKFSVQVDLDIPKRVMLLKLTRK